MALPMMTRGAFGEVWHNRLMSAKQISPVQIFGVKNSQATRAAERFFKERRVAIHFVDLTKKAMAPAEIRRFTDKFGLAAILDTESRSWIDAGLKYLKVSDAQM